MTKSKTFYVITRPTNMYSSGFLANVQGSEGYWKESIESAKQFSTIKELAGFLVNKTKEGWHDFGGNPIGISRVDVEEVTTVKNIVIAL